MTMAHSSSRALLPDMRETDEHTRVAAFYGALFAPGTAQRSAARDLRSSLQSEVPSRMALRATIIELTLRAAR